MESVAFADGGWTQAFGDDERGCPMFSRVCFHHDLTTSEIIRNLLTENGLHPTKLDYSAHVSVAGAEQGYFVEVPQQEAERAEKILVENNWAKYIIPRAKERPMQFADDVRRERRPRAMISMCFVTVALASPFNVILDLYCWSFLSMLFGGNFADNSLVVRHLVLALAQTGLFALLLLVVYTIYRRLSDGMIIAATILYLGFWLVYAGLVYGGAARTDRGL